MKVYILSGARTPSGSFNGSLSSVPAVLLGATAISAAVEKAGINVDEVDEVFMGNVVQAGQGQAPARQAVMASILKESVPCTTINKVCGSGMKTVITAAQTIKAGDNNLVIAGGMENMSAAPYFIPQGRNGYRFGDGELKDAMAYDGLTDPYKKVPMGIFAEKCAEKYGFTREAQDAFAKESFIRAQKASQSGIFKDEIVPVIVKGRKETIEISEDESPFKVQFDKMPLLKPAFDKNGTVTAANASSINDGAAAIVVAGEKYKNQAKFEIVAYSHHAQDPEWFTTAPIGAMKKCFELANLKSTDIDLYEINEAFAVVTMAAMKEFNLDHNMVNIYGGGVSLGHPIGCSGSRILVTLMNAMNRQQAKYGMAAICIGGGEATAMIIKRL